MVNVMDKGSEGRSNQKQPTKEKLCVDTDPIGSRPKSLGSPDTTISDDDFNRSLPSSPIADEKDEEGCLKRHLDVLGAPRGRPVAWAMTNPSGVMPIEPQPPERSCTRLGINGRGLPSSSAESPKNSHGLLSTVVGFVGRSTWTKTRDDEGSRIRTYVACLLISLPTLLVKGEKPNDSFPFKTNQELSRQSDKAMTTPRQPCSSGDQLTDDLDSEWSSLKSSLSALKNVVYEEDEGQETRPENIRVATGMIPLLKTGLSPRFPAPTVRTAFDGSIEFVWINGESLVTCCVQAEVKDQEIDITKSLPNQELIYRLLPYSPGDRLQEQAVVIVLQCYLGDAYPLQHKH